LSLNLANLAAKFLAGLIVILYSWFALLFYRLL